MARKQSAPTGLGPAGRRLWDEVTGEYEVSADDRVVLTEACEVLDTMAALKQIVKREGHIAESSQGIRTHPAVVELRQQRLVLARLLRLLGLPADDEPAAPAVRQRRQPTDHLRAVKGFA